MSVRNKDVKMLNDVLIGDIDLDTVNKLLYLKNNLTCVEPLTNMIFDFPKDIIDNIIRSEKNVFELYDREELKKHVGKLEQYQTVGVAFGALAKKFILGDAVGIGKTAQMTGLINYLSKQVEGLKVLVLTPKDILYQVQSEIARFTGKYYKVITVSDKDFDTDVHQMGRYEGIISNHGIVKNSTFATEVCVNNKFDMLVVDESSVFKNPNIPLTKSAKYLCNMFEYVLFMNATAFETDLIDLYSQIDLLDERILPPITTFRATYCIYDHRGMTNKFLGYKKGAAEKFKASVALRYFARSRKKLTGIDIHDKSDIRLKCVSMTVTQRLYIKDGYPWRIVLDSPTTATGIEMTPINVPKFQALLEVLEEDTESNSAFVYVEYKEAQYAICDYLNKEGYSAVVINGATTAKRRYEIQEKFRNGEITILISNLKRGVNLPKCDHVISYSLEVNTEKQKQIEGRVMRELIPEGKRFTQIITLNSPEDRYLLSVMAKRAQGALDFTETDKSTLPYVVELLKKEKESRQK